MAQGNISDFQKVSKASKVNKKMIEYYKAELNEIYSSSEPGKQYLIKQTIERLAFMLAQANALEKVLEKTGAIEVFMNGPHEMLRTHPASGILSVVAKQINVYSMQLVKLSGDGKKKSDLNDFLERKAKLVSIK